MTLLSLPRPHPARVPLAALPWLAIGVWFVWARGGGPFYDGIAYYVVDLEHLYDYARVSMIAYAAYRYAPPFAQMLDPFGALPVEVFMAGWIVLTLLALAYIGGRRWWLLLAFPVVLVELHAGNIHLLMAAAVVAGFRWPGAWAFLALTKVTPFVGVLWFAFRREWRKLTIALATTALIVLVGMAVSPQLWAEWFLSLAQSQSGPYSLAGPLWVRLPIALALLAWAAPRDQRWALPVVVVLAMPNLWLHSFAILAASIALHPRWQRA